MNTQTIPYGRHKIYDEDVKAIIDTLRSDFLTQGPKIDEFERELSKYCKAQFATSCNSATSALHLACMALDVQEGDNVWTSANTFVASANCALYCNANIDFIDIDLNTYNISVKNLREKLIAAKVKKALPKVIIVVHFAGLPCDMEEIYELSKTYNFKIIEDASHALGGKYIDEPIGNCKFSEITVFSFHPVKMITTGEGGACLTNNAVLDERLKLMRTHGITRSMKSLEANQNDELWAYQQIQLGFNYRMSDLEAALGTSQLSKIDYFVDKRRIIAAKYGELLKNLPIDIQYEDHQKKSSYHLYCITFQKSETKITQKELHDYMKSQNIAVNLHYIPVYLQPYYRKMGFERGHCPNAEQYFHTCVSLPIFPDLTDSCQTHVADCLKFILGENGHYKK